jgi:hypothetical protein
MRHPVVFFIASVKFEELKLAEKGAVGVLEAFNVCVRLGHDAAAFQLLEVLWAASGVGERNRSALHLAIVRVDRVVPCLRLVIRVLKLFVHVSLLFKEFRHFFLRIF